MKKKLLLSGIAAVALMAASTAHAAADLSLAGDTGVARTPLALTLAPMNFAIAADYVNSDKYFVPIRGEVGLPFNIEVGGYYDYLSMSDAPTIWGLNAKWQLPNFVENLNIAIGGHYKAQKYKSVDNNGHDEYLVASYVAKLDADMAVVPTLGVMYDSITGDNAESDVRWFGSLLLKAPMFAVGGEYLSKSSKMDGDNADGSYWIGGRFYMNEMITFQAGYVNNANFSDNFEENIKDGKFHVGVQFAFAGGK
jgi:hypothetical protein